MLQITDNRIEAVNDHVIGNNTHFFNKNTLLLYLIRAIATKSFLRSRKRTYLRTEGFKIDSFCGEQSGVFLIPKITVAKDSIVSFE